MWGSLTARFLSWRNQRTSGECADEFVSSESVSEYRRYALLKCKSDAEDADKLTRRFADLIRTLRVELTDEPLSPHSECLSVQKNEITFTPSNINVNDVRSTQKEQFLMTRQMWRLYDGIHVVIDMSGMTTGIMTALVQNSSTEDMRVGLECWATIPCRILSIKIVSPRHFTAWSTMVRIGLKLMSQKLQQRTSIVSADEFVLERSKTKQSAM